MKAASEWLPKMIKLVRFYFLTPLRARGYEYRGYAVTDCIIIIHLKLIGTWRPHRPRGMIGASMKSPGPKYALPGALGCNQHDVRKNVAPAYR